MRLFKNKKSSYASIIIKALEYTLFSVMMAITIAGIVRRETTAIENFNKIWGISIGLYFLSAFINHKFENVNSFVLTLFSMGAIVGSLILILGTTFYFFEIPLFIAFVFIWMKGINIEIHSEKIESLRTRILYGLIFFVLSYFLLFKTNLSGSYTFISHYYIPFYGILGFMMLNLVNMYSAYASGNFKINENQNVDRFSKIALAISVIVLLAMQMRFFNTWHIIKRFLSIVYDIAFKIISIVLFPILWVVEQFLALVKSRFAGEEVEKMEGLVKPSVMDIPQQDGIMITPGMETAFTIITWILLILLGCFMIWKVYQQIAIKAKKRVSTGSEEREFVFNLKDAYRELFNRSNNLNNSDKDPKHPIRRAYKEALIHLKSKGLLKPLDYTPKEYYEECVDGSSQLLEDEKSKFKKLTSEYQQVRFGSDDK
jgi:hypothetical protein